MVNNGITRVFLGLDKYLPQSAASKLLELAVNKNTYLDLSDILVLVHSSEGRRKLIFNLTKIAKEKGLSLLPPRICLTDHIFSPGSRKEVNLISPLERKLFLSGIVKDLDMAQYTNLFPNPPSTSNTFPWQFKIASLINDTISLLAENGYTIASVAESKTNLIGCESIRWSELSEIEKQYQSALSELGLKDSDHHKIHFSQNPSIPEGIRKVILIGVMDPLPILTTTIGRISEKVPTGIWIYADERDSDGFDSFGRPIYEFWKGKHIKQTSGESPIFIEGTPEQQAGRVEQIMRQISENKRDLSIGDITVFSINSKLAPFIKGTLESSGLEVFDPSGTPVIMTEAIKLIKAIISFYSEKDYSSFSALLRNNDYLLYIKDKNPEFDAFSFLQTLDLLQNKYKSNSFDSLKSAVQKEYSETGKYRIESTQVSIAIRATEEFLKTIETSCLFELVRKCLSEVYGNKKISAKDDALFIKSVEKITESLNELKSLRIKLPSSSGDLIYLFNEYLRNQNIYMEHQDNAINLQGWLESFWSGSKYLILAGVNEGFLPSGGASNLFISEKIKEGLGLRNNKTYFARDAYILYTILKTRNKEDGNFPPVSLIVGRYNTDTEALKPSRLLYLCDDEELLSRIEKFWGQEGGNLDALELKDHDSNKNSFELKLFRKEAGSRISASTIKTYLESPLMYYLKYVLKMKSVDDSSSELDNMEFGTFCHFAFEELGKMLKEDFPDGQYPDEEFLRNNLHQAAENYVKSMFGADPSLSIQIAMESVKSRLSKAAEVLREDFDKGWQILYVENKCELEMDQDMVRLLLEDKNVTLSKTYTISGKCDRIDINHKLRKIRILDYKTSESGKGPSETHMAGIKKIGKYKELEHALFEKGNKTHRWIDLQLPVYYMIISSLSGIKKYNYSIESAYFNIPSSLDKTTIAAWKGSMEEDMQSAKKALARIILNIDRGIFGIIGVLSEYDKENFHRLFNDDPDRYLDISELGNSSTEAAI